ncbi:5TMR of 5TMR-LYT [uncultured archaeon]|nr:5TMR of 5TMR-LYT [uncultured archaeon]
MILYRYGGMIKLSAAGIPQSMIGEYLGLFASTEIFIFVFMEIVTKIDAFQRVIFKNARLNDYIVFTLLLGLFSIFGTYIGTAGSYGAISNIRDLAPMVAGLVAGPYVGLAVGLIGGIHRLLLGGLTSVPCSIATVLAGLFAGLVYRLKKEELLGIVPAMLFAFAIEVIHGGLALLLVHPYSVALEVVFTSIPKMIIANSLGIAICVIIIHGTHASSRSVA